MGVVRKLLQRMVRPPRRLQGLPPLPIRIRILQPRRMQEQLWRPRPLRLNAQMTTQLFCDNHTDNNCLSFAYFVQYRLETMSLSDTNSTKCSNIFCQQEKLPLAYPQTVQK